jgi:hypothetical protein
MKKDRTFEIDNVKFELQVIPPMEGWDICELFRESVGNPAVLQSMTQDASSPEAAAKKLIMGLLLSIYRNHLLQLRTALFEYVTFKVPEQPKPLPLAGVEDMAFASLNPFAIYEVMGRCFSVNFTEYFNEMMTRLGIDVSALQEKPEEEPSDSSP